jgi:hypothetical protein
LRVFISKEQTKETDENNKSNSVADNYSEVPDAPARPLCVLISFAVKQSLQGERDHLTLDGVTI